MNYMFSGAGSNATNWSSIGTLSINKAAMNGMFENSKYGNYATISIYNDMDKYGIKSFALGSQFVLIESTNSAPCDTIIRIEEMESRVLKFMAFLNSSRFPDIYQNSECCLMSRY